MKYVAFFRGINVGGRNIVKMDELKALFADLGYTEVKSYIQSGNIVFASDAGENNLIDCISAAFEKRFGFASEVILRSAVEMADIVECKAFPDAAIAEAEQHNPDVVHQYVYLSESTISREETERITGPVENADQIYVGNREIFLLCHDSIRDSKLAATLAKLNMPLTARNMKTMNKIRQMLE